MWNSENITGWASADTADDYGIWQMDLNIADNTTTMTGFEGNYTSREDTIRSFEELCSGKWDHLPDQAFMYVGTIEEAAAKAEEMAKV